MAELHTETVEGGQKARWPYTSGYTDPTRDGYVFDGWKFNGVTHRPPYNDESNNPFGPINGDTDIIAQWKGFDVYIEAEPTQIGYEGGTSTVKYWAKAGSDIITSNDVIRNINQSETTIPSSDYSISTEQEISGQYRSVVFTLNENESEEERHITLYSSYKNKNSEEVSITQLGNGEIYIPDFDYFVFTYYWSEADGKDLDSATVINSTIPISSNKSLSDYFVGYGTNIPMDLLSTVSQYIVHGGDNVRSGAEGAMINFKKLRNDTPTSQKEITIDIYGNWFELKYEGWMYIKWAAYKGGEPPSKEGYEFIPDPASERVAGGDDTRVDLYVNAFGSNNIITPNWRDTLYNVKDYYSKLATLTCRAKYNDAKMKPFGGPTRGREIKSYITLNGVRLMFNGNNSIYRNEEEVNQTIEKNTTSGSLNFSSIELFINGVSQGNLILTEGNTDVTLELSGFNEGDVEYQAVSNEQGGLTINWTCPENNTGNSRNFVIYLGFTNDEFRDKNIGNYTLPFKINQKG